MSWVKAATTLQEQSSNMEEMREMLKQFMQVSLQQQQAQTEANRQLIEHLIANREAPVVANPPTMGGTTPEIFFVRRTVQRALQKMTAEDDVEAYLTVFERVAEREKLPAAEWAEVIAPYLTGEPQKAYYDLSEQEVKDYTRLKAEVLARLGVTTAVRARRVRNWSYRLDKSARSQMYDLIHLARKWLEPDTSNPAQILEKVVMDRYLRALPADLQRWVGQGDPKKADELVNLVERFQATEDYLRDGPTASSPPRSARSVPSAGKRLPSIGGVWRGADGGKRAQVVSQGQKTGDGPGWLSGSKKDSLPRRSGPIQCWRCHEAGHVSAHCPLTTEPMECDASRRQSLFAEPSCVAVPGLETEPQICNITINDFPVKALMDSGSLVTLVHASLVAGDLESKKHMSVVCIHGDIKVYPIVLAKVGTEQGTVQYEVGVVKNLMHNVILGRDFPLFWALWEKRKIPERSEDTSKVVALSTVNDKSVQDENDCFPLQVLAGEEEAPPTEQNILDLEVSRDNFGAAQLQDPTLKNARERVAVMNGVPQEPDADKRFPHFSVTNDLVYRVNKVRDEIVEQLLVPKPYPIHNSARILHQL